VEPVIVAAVPVGNHYLEAIDNRRSLTGLRSSLPQCAVGARNGAAPGQRRVRDRGRRHRALYSVTNELVARVVGAAMLVVGLVRNRRRADGGTADPTTAEESPDAVTQ